MLSHHDIWTAIDRLAERHALSVSALAKKAGLSSTLFNPSKRISRQRPRWPSTESIAAILKATDTTLAQFVALVGGANAEACRMPFFGLREAAQPDAFTAEGTPNVALWDKAALSAKPDGTSYMIEITAKVLEPAYREGDRIILSPVERVRRGDHILVKLAEGALLLRQLGREGAQKIELLPLTPDTPPQTLARSEVLWIHRVLWVNRR